MIKTVIIDDEINSRELLYNMLTNFCEDIEIIGTAKDVSSGIEVIKQKKPALVFLDIEMPGGNGFDILNELDEINFKVVFVTGYDQYAIKAIKYAALDYILKPVDLEELKMAVEKAKINIADQEDKINFLQSKFNDSSKEFDQIIIASNHNHYVVNLDDILYFEALDGYSVVVLDSQKTHTSAHPLSYYENLLPSNQFFRIHKSYLINCKKVTKYDPGRGGNVSILSAINLPIATRRKSLFISFMNRLGQ